MINKLFRYLTYLILLTSCSEDDIAVNDNCNLNLPVTNQWIVLDSMNVGRYDAAFEMTCNKIFVLGGTSNDPRSGQYYDLESNRWFETADLIERQTGVTSELVDDKIYLFGNQFSSKVQYYDIATDSWSYTNDFPAEHLYWATSESFNDQIYVTGGYIPSEQENPKTMFIFDTETETYTESTIPSDLKRPRSIRVDGLFYLWSPGVLFSYNPTNNSWKKIESAANYIMLNQEAVFYKEKILFIGGSETSGKNSATTTDITIYDPKTDDWSIIPSNINFKRHYGYGVFSKDTSLFIVGGREAITWESINELEYISDLKI